MDSLPLYERACELYRGHNDWRAYAQVVDRYLPHLVTDEEKLATLKDLARVQEERQSRRSGAGEGEGATTNEPVTSERTRRSGASP